MQHGDPIRFGFVGSTGSTSVPLGTFVPGSNTPYVPLSTDWFYLTSLNVFTLGTYGVVIVSSTGMTYAQLTSSTLLLPFNSQIDLGFWHSDGSEAVCGPQGVVPSVLTAPYDSTAINTIGGTGFVVHGPGTGKPPWMA